MANHYPRQDFIYKIEAEGTAVYADFPIDFKARVRAMPEEPAKWRLSSHVAEQQSEQWLEDFSSSANMLSSKSSNIVKNGSQIELAIDPLTSKYYETGYICLEKNFPDFPPEKAKLENYSFASPLNEGSKKADIIWLINNNPMEDYVDKIKGSAAAFIQELSSSGVDWRAAVAAYDDEAHYISGHDNWIVQASQFSSALDSYSSSGAGVSNLTNSLDGTISNLFSFREDSLKIIIVFTNEPDNEDASTPSSPSSQNTVINKLNTDGIIVNMAVPLDSGMSGNGDNTKVFWQKTHGIELNLDSPVFTDDIVDLGGLASSMAMHPPVFVSKNEDVWVQTKDSYISYSTDLALPNEEDDDFSSLFVKAELKSPGGLNTPVLSLLDFDIVFEEEVFENTVISEELVSHYDGNKIMTQEAYKVAPPMSSLTGDFYPSPSSSEVKYTLEDLSSASGVVVSFTDDSMISYGGKIAVKASNSTFEQTIVEQEISGLEPIYIDIPSFSYSSNVVYDLLKTVGPSSSSVVFESSIGDIKAFTKDSSDRIKIIIPSLDISSELWKSTPGQYSGFVNASGSFSSYSHTVPAGEIHIPEPGDIVNGKKLHELKALRYRITGLQLTSADGQNTEPSFQIYFKDTNTRSSKTFPDSSQAIVPLYIEAFSTHQTLAEGDPLPELPESWSDYSSPNDLVQSGIGDLDDLLVTFDQSSSIKTEYQVVGRYLDSSSSYLRYPSASITAIAKATAKRPWDNYAQNFKYEVTAYPIKTFSFTISGTASIIPAIIYGSKAKIRLPSSEEVIISELGDMSEISEIEAGTQVLIDTGSTPKKLFDETIELAVDSYVESWALDNNYDINSIDILEREIETSPNSFLEVYEENGYMYASIVEDTQFSGSGSWTNVTVSGYESPKVLTGMLVEDVPLVNSNGKSLAELYMEGQLTCSFVLSTDESEAEVLFNGSGTTVTDLEEDFVEAIYDSSFSSGIRNGSVTYPGHLEIDLPVLTPLDADYNLRITEGEISVAGWFQNEDSSFISDTTASAVGAWTDNENHIMYFTVLNPLIGFYNWESLEQTFQVNINASGDYDPGSFSLSSEMFSIPSNAQDIRFEVEISTARAIDGANIEEYSDLYFRETREKRSILFGSVAEVNQAMPTIEFTSNYSKESTTQELKEEIIYRDEATINSLAPIHLADTPVPNRTWHSFYGKADSPDVLIRIERTADGLNILGQLLRDSKRWQPQISAGTYYNYDIEYLKLNQPAVFSVNPSLEKDTVAFGTLVVSGEIFGEEKEAARILVSAPIADNYVSPHNYSLLGIFNSITGYESLRNISISTEGPIDARLVGGVLELKGVIGSGELGVFRQKSTGTVFPVETPLKGPVIVWDSEYPSRVLTRLDGWENTDFIRELVLIGTGKPIIPLPIPHSSLVSCMEDEENITGETNIVGPAVSRVNGVFAFGKEYKVKIKAHNAYAVDPFSPELKLYFSDNDQLLKVAAEQEGSPYNSEDLTTEVPWVDPLTSMEWVEDWKISPEPFTLFPYSNPINEGFLLVSNKKNSPSAINLTLNPYYIYNTSGGFPLHVGCSVLDSFGNPVGGEVVTISASWFSALWHERTDEYGVAAVVLPAPNTPGTYSVTVYNRALAAEEEVVVE